MLAEELAAVWPERWPRPSRHSTKSAASQVKHFGRFFAGRKVTSITRSEFRAFAMEHPGAARYARTMLYDALDEGIVEENVGAGVRIPKPRSKKPTPPSINDLEELVNFAGMADADRRFGHMIMVAAYTGLREGELRALAVEDLEFGDPSRDGPTRGIVRFSLNREEELVEPKTEESFNRFAIFPRARHCFKLAGAGISPVRERRCFPYTRGQRQALWDTVREESGVSCRWHDLRHYCATWLLDNGATVDDVALQLRCSVDEVRKTYGHPDREQALTRLEGLVS